MPLPLRLLVFTLAGFIQRGQQDAIDYLLEENRVLREQLGGRRLKLTNAQRRRLAIRARKLGMATLRKVSNLVSPDTLLRWYRQLVAQKYDGSSRRREPISFRWRYSPTQVWSATSCFSSST